MRIALALLMIVALAMGAWSAQPTAAAPDAQVARTVRVDLVGRSWLQAVVNGQTQFQGVLVQGDSRQWSGTDIFLKIGNAAAVRVTVDGQSLGVLGSEGQVVSRRWDASTAPAAPAPPTTAPPTAAPAMPTAAPATPEPAAGQGSQRDAQFHTVVAGDTLSAIAKQYDVSVAALQQANNLGESTTIRAGQQLAIPGSDGSLPAAPPAAAGSAATSGERGSPMERQTRTAQRVSRLSPFYRTTWVTYYGRPNVAVMGILGEYSIDDLVPRLEAQAEAYDEANGPELAVMPVFHLVYGMATKGAGDDGSHLVFLSDEVVMEYIRRAQEEGFAVILDIQIGALEPAVALERGLPFLEYPNVHLALDPEFAMSHPNQERPGNPIGFVTAAQVNEAQRVMRDYMRANNIPGWRALLLHQFLEEMIRDKETLERLPRIDLVVTADGWGGPSAKVSKYNDFVTPETAFSGFKLFYRWDEPLLTESQVLGVDARPNVPFVEVTPNLIIYQ